MSEIRDPYRVRVVHTRGSGVNASTLTVLSCIYKGVRIRVALFNVNFNAFEWAQIDEIILDVIQQPSVRLTLREEVWITPTVNLVFQDRFECRYPVYQTES